MILLGGIPKSFYDFNGTCYNIFIATWGFYQVNWHPFFLNNSQICTLRKYHNQYHEKIYNFINKWKIMIITKLPIWVFKKIKIFQALDWSIGIMHHQCIIDLCICLFKGIFDLNLLASIRTILVLNHKMFTYYRYESNV